MKIVVNLHGPIAEEVGSEQVIELHERTSLSIQELIQIIESSTWNKALVDDGLIKSPYVLLVDDTIVKMNSNPKIEITEQSKIDFVPILTGG